MRGLVVCTHSGCEKQRTTDRAGPHWAYPCADGPRDIKTRLIDSQPQTEQPVKLGGADSGSVNVAKQNQTNQSGGCC